MISKSYKAIQSKINTTIRARIASTEKTIAQISNFFDADALILRRRSDIRWQKIAIKAKKMVEYSQMLETTWVQIATIITITMIIMAPQLIALEFLNDINYLYNLNPYGVPLSPLTVRK